MLRPRGPPGPQFSTYSYDDYGIVSRIWSWGDGTPAEEGEWVRHTYTANGTYVITLTVVDAAGQRSMKQENVVVTTPSPEIGGRT